MKSYDKYDLLLEVIGLGGKDKIPDCIIELNMERIMKLADEIGVKLNSETFYLELINDDINDMMDVALALYECCGLDSDVSMSVMMKAHDSGSALILHGIYKELKEIKDKLNERNLTVCISRIDKNG